jgi:hypothetical protein
MAGVFPLDIVAPGAFGVNTEKQNVLLRPQWATKALNGVVNRAGRLAARKGWQNQTTNAIASTPQIAVMHEYLNEAGASVIISTATTKIYKDIDDFTDAANDITSTTAPTNPYWQFVNFNGKVLGFQRGEVPIERTSGDFTDASYTGTGPDGNCAVAAFGRVWAADADLQTVRYCALLDDTDYTTASGGGTIDMSSVWTGGMDEIVAIEAIGSTLVVFGKNHIVMWADKAGSEIGLDPTALEVVDTIEGTGCIARDSVAVTGEGDIIFLSRHGLQSLGRVIASKSNPTVTLTKNVRTDVQEAIVQSRSVDGDLDRVQATVSPEQGLYIINFPSIDKQFVLDIQHPFDDDEGDTVFPVTDWILGGTIGALLTTTDGSVYFGSSGVVGKYAGNNDNTAAYDFEMNTGWLDFGDPQINHRLKILKEIVASVQIGEGSAIWNWEFDFDGTKLTRTQAYTGGTVAEFNIAEFSDGGGAGIGYNDPDVGATSGETEFAGGAVIQRKNLPAHGEGQFLRLGVTSSINDFDMVIQHLSISPKIGRMVT